MPRGPSADRVIARLKIRVAGKPGSGCAQAVVYARVRAPSPAGTASRVAAKDLPETADQTRVRLLAMAGIGSSTGAGGGVSTSGPATSARTATFVNRARYV